MALDDVAGRAEKRSVLDYYGESREDLRIMSSLGFTEDYDLLIEKIKNRIEEGFLPKVKLGKTVEEDLATLHILDSELLHDTKFAIDFNARYSLEEVEEFLSVLIYEQKFNPKRVVLWEQPTRKFEGIGGLKTFKDFLCKFDPEVIVVADESFVDVEDAIKCAENGIGLNYKIHKIGGLCIAHEIERTLRERSLLKQNSLVGGTFPTAIGRVYDRQAGVSLSSTKLPSDGMEPSSNWFKGPKHFIKEEFLQPDTLGKAKAHKGNGSGVTVDWEKISEFVVNNPKEEYRAVRKGLPGEKIKIQLRGKGTYAEKYKEITGRDSEWNL
jgi:L-alanine-DL-glutamate epimerase-like enolase superfamily enzyme